MFLTNIGSGDLRPSFFEMYAQTQVLLALRGALKYTIEVLALRHPILFRIVERADDLFFLLHLLVQANSLFKSNATVAEAFYGLRREFVDPKWPKKRDVFFDDNMNSSNTTTASSDFSSPSSSRVSKDLTKSQILSSLITEVCVPYIRNKLDDLHENLSGGSAAELFQSTSLRRGALQPRQDRDSSTAPGQSNHSSQMILRLLVRSSWLRGIVRTLFIKYYPLIRSSYDVAYFGFSLSYLFSITKYYTPLLYLQRLVVRRKNINELKEEEAQEPSSEVGASVSPYVSRLMTVMNLFDRVITILKISLVVGVFIYKFAEFYYAEQKKMKKNTGVVPNPPSIQQPHPDGIPLPKSKKLCPLCLKTRTNPAACGSSGYVFCYACLFQHLEKSKRCPITLLPATIDDMRRIYDESS